MVGSIVLILIMLLLLVAIAVIMIYKESKNGSMHCRGCPYRNQCPRDYDTADDCSINDDVVEESFDCETNDAE